MGAHELAFVATKEFSIAGVICRVTSVQDARFRADQLDRKRSRGEIAHRQSLRFQRLVLWITGQPPKNPLDRVERSYRYVHSVCGFNSRETRITAPQPMRIRCFASASSNGMARTMSRRLERCLHRLPPCERSSDSGVGVLHVRAASPSHASILSNEIVVVVDRSSDRLGALDRPTADGDGDPAPPEVSGSPGPFRSPRKCACDPASSSRSSSFTDLAAAGLEQFSRLRRASCRGHVASESSGGPAGLRATVSKTCGNGSAFRGADEVDHARRGTEPIESAVAPPPDRSCRRGIRRQSSRRSTASCLFFADVL